MDAKLRDMTLLVPVPPGSLDSSVTRCIGRVIHVPYDAALTAITLIIAPLLLMTFSPAEGATYNATPGESLASIQSAINDPNYDTIKWTPGTYQLGLYQHYVFAGEKTYTFEDGVTVRGFTTEVGIIFKTIGSNIDVIGTGTVVFENAPHTGIITDDGSYTHPYTNVSISGITSKATSYHFEWLNIQHDSDRQSPDVAFSHMTIIGGSTGFHFGSLNIEPDKTSPYVSIDHVTADGLYMLVDLFCIDDGGQVRLVGEDDINKVALLNSYAPMPQLWQWFNSPSNLAQQNVTEPYINAATNCFVTADMNFVPGTYVPQVDSPLNLGNGEYIGAYAPIPEPGTLLLVALSGVGLVRRRQR